MWLNNLLKKYNVYVHRFLIFIIVAKLFRKNCYKKNTFTACLKHNLLLHKQLFAFNKSKKKTLFLGWQSVEQSPLVKQSNWQILEHDREEKKRFEITGKYKYKHIQKHNQTHFDNRYLKCYPTFPTCSSLISPSTQVLCLWEGGWRLAWI